MKNPDYMVMPISTECKGSGVVFEKLLREGLYDSTKTLRRKGVGKFKISGQVIVGIHKDKERCTLEGAYSFMLKLRAFCERQGIKSIYLRLTPFASDGLDRERLLMMVHKAFNESDMEVLC